MFTASNWKESDERNLHTSQCTEGEPSTIADVQSWTVPAHANENKSMKWQQIRNEYIASPCRYHIAVEQCSQCTPHGGSILNRLNPQVEGEYKKEYSNSLVIVASSNRS